MAHRFSCSFAILVVLGCFAWQSLCERDLEVPSPTGSDVAADSTHDDTDKNPLEAIKKMGEIVKKAAEMKRIQADNAQRTASMTKALGVLLDAKKRVKAAMLENKSETMSLSDVLPKDFSETLRNALQAAGVGNNANDKATPSTAEVGSSGKSDSSLLSVSDHLDIPGRFSAMVERVTKAANRVESDATVLHGMYGSENGKMNTMLSSLTKAAKYVQNTAQTLGVNAPTSDIELQSASNFLLEAERNMGMTSRQLGEMKGRLEEVGRNRLLKGQGPSLLALNGQETDAGHATPDDEGSILHESDPKLTKKLNRRLHQLVHADT